ncbi:MAG: glycogen debranching protein GlgX [Acidobacteriota bacterium]
MKETVVTVGAHAAADVRGRLLSIVGADLTVGRGTALPLGAVLVRGGVNFSIFSHYAASIKLLLFSPGGRDPVIEVPLNPRFHRTGDVWHVFVGGLTSGFEYGYQIDGPASPRNQFNPRQILIDPYAHALAGGERWAQAPVSPRRAIVPAMEFDWGRDQPLNTPLSETVIYEMHVRGFTNDPSSGVSRPGTFAGLTEKIPYLKALGVTAIELMPVTEFDELNTPGIVNPLTDERLVNYWGYHPLSFFAPKASYASDAEPGAAVHELKYLVRECHAAGIEVILDLVFNHTGEGRVIDQTSSLRGIDNATYYITDPVTGAYRDYTGCGNTLNCNHPVVRDLVLDCLRYWVTEMHVDGFRFDLASVLARGVDGEVLAEPPLLERITGDPVLSRTKLIAEAWDAVGLYQVGSFPAWGRWAEWNGRFRDDVRRFVKGDAGLAPAVASRLSGSPDLYRADGRSAHHSINFITSHDGFTLADLVSYNVKHNEANGEDSRDGVDQNDSWNCGWEGAGAPEDVERLRRQQMRNLLALLFLSQGVPMLLAGDECGRTQRGNNNAYCQDSPVSWMPWADAYRDRDLARFVTELIAFRKAHPQLTTQGFLDADVNGQPVVDWHGVEPHQPDWSDESRLVAFRLFATTGTGDLYIAANAHWEPAALRLPPTSSGRPWRRVIDTSLASPADIVVAAHERPAAGPAYLAAARSVVVLEG